MAKNRRDFLKVSAATGMGLALSPGLSFANQITAEKVRIAFIGVGERGRVHLKNMLQRTDVSISAICDVDPLALTKAKELINESNFSMPDFYAENEYSFMDLLERKDIDGVIISTPWLWHTRMAVAAMQSGKHVGVEVSAANTLEECWDLIEAHEETGKHCMILENVCYRYDVMAVLQMVRGGLFGELVHARCGYLHDLRHVKFNNGKQPYGGGVEFGEKGFSEAKWRTTHSLHRNGDLYPTHGIGPIATMMDINRGNRFVSITSTATKSRGIHNYIVNHPEGGEGHPNAKLNWKLGDVVTSIVSTSNGESIVITHDTSLPRPYSLGFSIQGVKGIAEFSGGVYRTFIEGVTEGHKFEELKKYYEKYEHPLWTRHKSQATGSGHGGMDFFVLNAFVEFIKRGDHPPMDVYDAAAWSAVTPLSEISIANNGEPQDFPDFTRGKWMTNKPIFAMKGDKY